MTSGFNDRASGTVSRRDLLTAAASGAGGLIAPRWAQAAASSAGRANSIMEIGKLMREGGLSSVELTKSTYDCVAQLESKLAAFITVTRDKALEQAALRDAELRRGVDRGPLHGIPIVQKDMFDTAGIPTTGGSEFYRSRVPTADATIVKRLDLAGAVMLGKTNMNELAAGVASTNQAFGDTPNPWNLERSSGGSSQGTAAAIAAGYCLAGTGGDTGGSIRVPASWCGIAGLRPTYGLVSLAGAMLRAPSLDTGGPLGKTVGDVAIMMDAMAGYDAQYRQSIRAPKTDYLASTRQGVKGLRVGLIENYSFRDVDSDVVRAVQGAADTLKNLGADIKTVKIPLLGAQFNYQILFDLVLYEVNQILGDQFRTTRNNKEVFGPVVQANIARGEQITRETYEAARRERPRLIAEVRRVFSEVDVLLTPTMPMTALPLHAPAQAYDRGRQFSLPISFLGLPSLSVPCGFDTAGMPIGMLLVGDLLKETTLLQAGAAYEGVHRHYLKRPQWHCQNMA